jgi:L-fucose mutarotase
VLKGIHPLITPELLGVLVEMGHGDDLAVVDANFPATSVAMETAHGRVVHLASASVPEAVAAVLSPWTASWSTLRSSWGPRGTQARHRPSSKRSRPKLTGGGRHMPLAALGRHEFYVAARRTYAVVQTGELRWWANVILKKGAFAPDLAV